MSLSARKRSLRLTPLFVQRRGWHVGVDAFDSFQVKIALGSGVTRGLGAGGKPEVGEAAAKESLPDIEKTLAGADMVFVTAGKHLPFFSFFVACLFCKQAFAVVYGMSVPCLLGLV